MKDKITLHKDRSIIEISGVDRHKFLQGLITNDINLATEKNLIYCAMLNAQGRFLYDFFIFETAEKLMIDCSSSRRDEILKKLIFYKLRSQVEIKKNDELMIGQILDDNNLATKEVVTTFADPRSSKLGKRIYGKNLQSEIDSAKYHFTRIENKIPQSEDDLTYEKSFILEFSFDELSAVNYTKGCYVGQEPTARIHYLGEIRKKIFHVKIPNAKNIEKNLEITCEGKDAGIILSSVFFNNELHALALLKLSALENKNNSLRIDGFTPAVAIQS